MISILGDIHPHTINPARVQRGMDTWRDRARETGDPAIVAFADDVLENPATGAVFRAVFDHSPYLTQILAADVDFARTMLERGWDETAAAGLSWIDALPVAAMGTATIMTALRRAKRRMALTIAMADISGEWALEQVTEALSATADAALRQALAHLLAQPAFRTLPDGGAGFLVMGMGKLGARELNYSSDIDLIIFYDDSQFSAGQAEDLQPVFIRLARALVRVMDERTGDGYVFRTDLRLRPDPSSTPLAVSLSAAEIYYGSLGQNWERAALIKARPIAGGPAAAAALMDFLRPWIWRRNLDFAAIEDIHAIKRQINRHKLKPAREGLMGHNIKLGQGGIREIEFFAQTQQLIFGGRDVTLRTPGACDALRALAAAGRIDDETAAQLIEAYRFLRKVEHRLQMVDDRQTHTLPTTAEGMGDIAAFMGFRSAAAFTHALEIHLARVQDRFSALFGRSPSLSGLGNLVFTGVEDDPDTLETLRTMGFGAPAAVAAAIRAWHHGRYRAMRSERARELLTKLTPSLLEALAETAEPDAAFLHFDAFLAALPAGVMLLALLSENPHILGLLGRIMGMAPALADQLAQQPALLDELLSGDFFGPLPDLPALIADLDRALALAGSYEEALIRLRRWAAGRKFQAGVQILESVSDGVAAGRFLAAIAEAALARLLPLVEAEFAARHGTVPGGSFAIVAFGRLGGRLMSFSSDLDIVTIYDAPEGALSDGGKPLDAPLYFTRLTQRVIAAITAPMAEGRLYEVDLRLRPSGEAGPVAASLEAFRRYHRQSAWTWEQMALTRARPVAGPPALCAAIERVIADALTTPRDPARLVSDVAQMRRRIAEQHPARSRWDLKYAPGGLIDVEFVIQYALLSHAAHAPELLSTETAEAIDRLTAARRLAPAAAADLGRALRLAWDLQGLLRLLSLDSPDLDAAPAAIKARLAAEIAWATSVAGRDRPRNLAAIDFSEAETILDDILAASHRRFDEIVGRGVTAGLL